MTQTLFQANQSVLDPALTVLSVAARTSVETILSKMDDELNQPLRLRAERPATANLVITASQVASGDTGKKVASALNDTVGDYAQTTINFQTGSISGGTVVRDGASFSFPTSTIGQFRRVAFVYQPDQNRVDCTFSAEAGTVGALTNAGLLFSILDGIPLGYIDVVATGATAFKTAGSATNVIENSVSGTATIFRFGAGSSGGAGGINDFRIASITTPTATIKGGYFKLDFNRELATYDGAGAAITDYGKDLAINLTTVLGSSPANATTYYLYIDLLNVNAEVTPTGLGRKVYGVTEASFKLFTTSAEPLNPRRYVPVGVIASATTGNAWSGTGSSFKTFAIRTHDTVAGFFAEPEKKTYQITTAAASTVTPHTLSGEPQLVKAYYFDGTNKIGLDDSAWLLNKNATNIEVSTLSLTFGSGQYVEIQAVYMPTRANSVVTLQNAFNSSWFQNTSVTTLPHNLTDRDDIRGYEVQEWDVPNGKIRNLLKGELVLNFDDDNFYLDWTGIVPSANLRYRVVAGGTPIPATIPSEFGGFTHFVGRGPGSYATLAAAMAVMSPGDAVLVMRGYSISAAEAVSVDDVRVVFMPGVIITVTGGTTALTVSGSRCRIEGARYLLNFAGTLTNGVNVTGDDNFLDAIFFELSNAGLTVTQAVNLPAGGDRNYVNAGIKTTTGTLSLDVNNAGSGNNYNVRS